MPELSTCIAICACAIIFYKFYKAYKRYRIKQRKRFIENYRFPVKVKMQLQKTYPHLTKQDTDIVLMGLRKFFIYSARSGKGRMLSMPSQAVDVAWHEFILFTRMYDQFCQKGMGYFLHHTPAEAMKTPVTAQEGIKRTWRLACFDESIEQKNPITLPLLFSIDTKLNISDGFKYDLQCRSRLAEGNPPFCASHIRCTATTGCGGTGSGCGGDSSDSSDGFFGDSGCGGCGGCGG